MLDQKKRGGEKPFSAHLITANLKKDVCVVIFG